MLREIAGRAELDGPGGDPPRRPTSRNRARERNHRAIEHAVDRRARRSGSRCSQAPAGIAKRLGPCPDRQDPIGDVVDRGVITESPAHPLIEIDSQDVGPSGERQRIAADAGAEIDDQWTGESTGFVPGDRFRGGLFDGGRLDPHSLAVLELERRLCAGLGQANRGGNGRGRGLLSEAEPGRQDGSIGHSPTSASRRLPASVVRTQASASTRRVAVERSETPASIWTRVRVAIRNYNEIAVACEQFRPGVSLV